MDQQIELYMHKFLKKYYNKNVEIKIQNLRVNEYYYIFDLKIDNVIYLNEKVFITDIELFIKNNLTLY